MGINLIATCACWTGTIGRFVINFRIWADQSRVLGTCHRDVK